MNKVEINRLSQVNNNEQNFLAALNDNLRRIQQAINDTLSRTGVKPNQMEEVLDMNGNRICNVGKAIEPTDVVTKQDIQDIIDEAEEAIARIDGLVEAAKVALMLYANEYIYPAVNEALAGAQEARRGAEAARDALLNDSGYQAVVANIANLAELANSLDDLEAVLDHITDITTVANSISDINDIADNLTELLKASKYASDARIWAEGTDSQVVPLGGRHSAKGWAEYAQQIITGTRIFGGTFDASTAVATLTSAAKARLGTTDNTITLTNDTAAITGYSANEAVEYDVTVAGTFANLVLHVGDLLWSTGTAWHKIDNASGSVPDASENIKGIAMIATTAEAVEGVNDSNIMTPAKTKAQLEGNRYLTNNSSATEAIAIGTDAAAGSYGVAIGAHAKTLGNGVNTAIGYGAQIGSNAIEAIQLGRGINSETKTLKVGFLENNYTLIDSTGKIPSSMNYVLAGSDGTNDGSAGIVPAPSASDNEKFLKGDGTWGTAIGGVDVNFDPSTGRAVFMDGSVSGVGNVPDYSAGVTITNGWISPKAGVLKIRNQMSWTTTVYVDGSSAYNYAWDGWGDYGGAWLTTFMPIGAGCSITYEASLGHTGDVNITFYPYK